VKFCNELNSDVNHNRKRLPQHAFSYDVMGIVQLQNASRKLYISVTKPVHDVIKIC